VFGIRSEFSRTRWERHNSVRSECRDRGRFPEPGRRIEVLRGVGINQYSQCIRELRYRSRLRKLSFGRQCRNPWWDRERVKCRSRQFIGIRRIVSNDHSKSQLRDSIRSEQCDSYGFIQRQHPMREWEYHHEFAPVVNHSGDDTIAIIGA
jgi:hypothetical protein